MGRGTFPRMQKLGDSSTAAELSDRDVIAAITELTHAQNQTAARKYVLLDEFARRGLNLKTGHSTPQHYIASGTRVTLANSTRQFVTANWLSRWPSVTEALATSDIFVDHVKEIHDGYTNISSADSTLSEESLAAAVADLLATAMDGTAHQVKQRAQVLMHAVIDDARARYDSALGRQEARKQKEREAEEQGQPLPDDDPDDDPDPDADVLKNPPPQPVSENTALNKLELFLLANGRLGFKGDVDKVLGEKLRSALSPLSRPQPAPDGTRDPRSTSRRQADGLSRLLDLVGGGTRSAGPGTPPATVNVTVNLSDLLADRARSASPDTTSGTATSGATHRSPKMGDPDWPFQLEWTGPLSRSLARLLACDANLKPIIMDNNDVPLSMGKEVRLATPEQRAAVAVRDRCCVRCGLPAQWCQVHHIIFWEDGGPTDLTNLVLICGDCHRLVHNHGWDIDFGADGHPRVIPPAAIDPERKPIPSFHRQRRPAA